MIWCLNIKVSQKRSSTSISGVSISRQEQDDDQRSTSSREDETPFNSGGEPSPNLMTLSHNVEKVTSSLINERRGRLSAKKTRLSSTTSTTSTTSNAYLKDLVALINNYHSILSLKQQLKDTWGILVIENSHFQNDPTTQGTGSKDMLGILNEEDSGSEVGGDGDYFGRTPR